MKKVSSIIISLVMLISSLLVVSFSASAAGVVGIRLEQTKEVTIISPMSIQDGTAYIYQAKKSGKIYFYSTGDLDTAVAVSVNGEEENTFIDDDSYGLHFAVELDVKSGDTVTFVPMAYRDGTYYVTLSSKAPEGYVRCNHKNKELADFLPATFTEDGFTGRSMCLNCRRLFNDGTTIPRVFGVKQSWTQVVYNGKVQRPTIELIDNSAKSLVYKKDFGVSYSNWNSKNVGTYKVNVNLMGNYDGTRTYTYKIVPQTNVTPKLNRNTFTMSNNVQRPLVTVTDKNGKQLEYKKDFKVDYSNWNSKAVGRYTVTVTMLGNYSGKKTYAYYINPKGTTFLTSAQGGFKGIKNGFTVKWNKQTNNTTGYQIQYATRSDFSNAATIYAGPSSANSKTVTGRAGNTRYYVRIRTYKNIGGKYFYSDWSTGSKSVVTLR